MNDAAIEVDGISKQYRLGEIGIASLREEIERIWHRLRGRNPEKEMAKVGAVVGEVDSASSKDLWALKDVSFKVKRGEVLGIIGKNGAGKSTLLKILTRITEPTGGRALVRGKVASLLEVGTGFHPELSGRDNIYLNGAILGMKRGEIESRMDAIVAFAEVDRFLDTPVKRYSSGMYVRLAFAVAAHLKPDILLVDEVLAVGDISFQKKCLGKMGEVVTGGRTVLFVSHNMSMIRELCSKCLLLEGGGVEAFGPSQDVTDQYIESMMASRVRADLNDPNVRIVSAGWSTESKFRFKSVSVVNSRGKTTSSLAFAEPFVVHLMGEAREKMDDVKVGFAIREPMGRQILHSIQIDDGLPLGVDKGANSYVCRVDPNVLLPGVYELGVGARGAEVCEFVPVALTLHVSDVDQKGVPWDSAHGAVVRCPCKWRKK